MAPAPGSSPHDGIGPATAGGSRGTTLGGAAGGTMNSPAERPVHETDLATVDGDYALTLVRDDGSLDGDTDISSDMVTAETADLDIDAIVDVSPVREHSAISDWSISVPYSVGEELIRWARALMFLTLNGTVVFVGRVLRVDPSLGEGVVRLEGTDLGGYFDEGDHTFEVTDCEDWRAIERVWEDVAPRWDATVVKPPSQARLEVDELESEGRRLEVLQDVHDQLGYRFTIDHRRPFRVVAYRKVDLLRPPTWREIEADPMRDLGRYYNAASIYGRYPDDDPSRNRMHAYHEDSDEIERLMEEYGLTRDQATVTWSSTDPTLHTQGGVTRRARTRVDEFVDEGHETALVRATPSLPTPGPMYPVAGVDDEWRVGGLSLRFDGTSDGYVTLPGRVFDSRDLERQGAITLWARVDSDAMAAIEGGWGTAPWGSSGWGSPSTAAPIIGTNTDTIRFEAAEWFRWHLQSNLEAKTVDAYPDGSAPGDEWVLLHLDWSYDPDANETVVRAGHDDAGITDSVVVDGRLDFEAHTVWFGRDASGGRFAGYLDDPRIWGSPLDSGRYLDLYRGNDTHGPLRHRWPFTTGVIPRRGGPDDRIFDIVGAAHGTRQSLSNVTFAGSPRGMERVEYFDSSEEASSMIHFEHVRSLVGDVERLWQETRRTQRSI